MKTSLKFVVGFATAALGCTLLLAQEVKLTPEEQTTQEIAAKMIHDMNQYYHYDLAQQFIAEGYIQHNPNVPQGRAGYLKYMTRIPGRVPEPLTTEWKNKPALIITSGDIVLYVFNRTEPDPTNPGQTYAFNSFDMVRVANGLVQEHWDAAKKNPPGVQPPPPTAPAMPKQ